MTTTARDIVALALKEAGVLGIGQTALAEDINDGFTLLRRMLAQWQKRRWLVPALMDVSKAGNGEKSNTIGVGGYWDFPRPVDVKGGYFTQDENTLSFALRKIFSYEDYIRVALKELNSFPGAFFYDGAWPLGNIYIIPIPSSSYTVHLLIEKQLVFTGISEGEVSNAGAAYVDGVYDGVELTGGISFTPHNSLATANITVAGGIVTNVQIDYAGQDYIVGNVLSASNVDLGGAGAGFTYTVTALDNNLDYEFELPEEYEEAIHYNLAVRMISMYQVTNPSPQTGVLAKVALNTIKRANTQIPSLVMPAPLRRRNGFTLYDPDGYSGG